ncbi:hypothetical protein MUK42_32903, partial [Musa troglodytarum]
VVILYYRALAVARSSTNKIPPPCRTKRYESSKKIEAESDGLAKLSSASHGCESITDMSFAAEFFSGTFQSYQSWEMDSHITHNHIDASIILECARSKLDKEKRVCREINAAVFNVLRGDPSWTRKEEEERGVTEGKELAERSMQLPFVAIQVGRRRRRRGTGNESIHPTKLEALANGFHRLTFLNEAIDCNIDLRTYDSTPMSIQDLPHQNPSNPVTLTIPHEEYILQKHPRILRKAYNPGRIHGVRNLPPVSPTCHWPSTPSTCTPVVSVASAVTIRL